MRLALIPLARPGVGLRHERVALRRRLAREVVVALQHLRLGLHLALVAHARFLPTPNGPETVRQQAVPTLGAKLRKGVLVRLIVAIAGLFTMLVLVVPVPA